LKTSHSIGWLLVGGGDALLILPYIINKVEQKWAELVRIFFYMLCFTIIIICIVWMQEIE
jgi:hypothetical protein